MTSSENRLYAPMSRAAFLRLAAAGAAGLAVSGGSLATAAERIRTRPIPSSGEALPVIGVGTSRTFDSGSDADSLKPRAEVLRLLFEAGGSVIDTSPMYGRAEAVVGTLLNQLDAHDKAFIATKVWTRGRDAGVGQMRDSMAKMHRRRIELMQIHNLVDWRIHLPTLRAWKEEGLIRYIGITHYTTEALEALAAVIRAEPIDFVQLAYSIGVRDAENEVLPLAADRGVAVLVNRPYERGALFQTVADTPLPGWARALGCATWAQVFLKFILSHPAVTCVIPGTRKPKHLSDNVAAGRGRLPDEAERREIARRWQEI